MKYRQFAMSVIFCFLLCGSSFAQTSGNASVDVYARANPDSVLVASDDVWYLEELDEKGRPKSAVRWIKGITAEKTVWTYDGPSQQAVQKTVTTDKTATSESSITETRYDHAGNEVLVTVSNIDGTLIEKTENSWTKENAIDYTIFTKAETVLRSEYVYGINGELAEKISYRNGELELHCEYEAKDTWTEYVYYKGRKILTVRYENGIRLGNRNER